MSTVKLEKVGSKYYVENTCDYCSKSYLQEKSNFYSNRKHGRRSYCSKKCASKAQTTKTEVNCKFCNKILLRTPKEILQSKNSFCDSSCCVKYYNEKRGELPTIEKFCGWCNKSIIKKQWEFSKTKSGENFCSPSCASKYFQKNKTSGYRRSRSETYLSELIHQEFGNRTVVTDSDRSVCSGLELDISLPEIKLAIEWNGIFHYEPIFGEDKLSNIQDKDKRKQQILNNLGWELIVVPDKSSRFNKKYVTKIFEQIKSIIEIKLSN